MSDERRTCPECGAEERPDGGGPSCACEAEGFGPLRIRPYVTLPEPTLPVPPRVSDPYARAPLPPEQKPADTTAGDPDDGADAREPRRPPALLLAAVAGVLSVAALVAVLISSSSGGGGPDTSAQAADTESLAVSASAPTRQPSPTASPSPSASTRNTTPPASPSATRSSSAPASPTPTRSRVTTPPPTPTPTTPSPSHGHGHSSNGNVLRRGDTGPQVSELQSRLAELRLYDGTPTGTFDSRTQYALATYQFARGLDEDPPGTYGPSTRRALESET
ncbi:peptidoglycan-binding domain-containing protein [Streptomyces sp. NPDC050085]|uniref:peptidoglycan-binding domain-containing protein n=1 Tax=Streptomyces sp. NPDC050085 TaxID=3365600 RepID=UPI00379CFC49